MSAEAVITVENVSKKFCKNTNNSMVYALADISRNLLGLGSKPGVLRKNEFWAVDDLSFEVHRGETLGLIGPNGSGKTTLLKMLNGIFWPDKGKITIKGRVGALIAVGAGFHPLLTGRENIYVNAAILGMNKKEVDEKFDQIVDFADIGDFLDTPIKSYSSGMHVRLGFAVAVHCDPDILLVDEVLAVGDEGFQNKCFNRIGELRSRGVTTILVSHNMHAISAFCGRAILMGKGVSKNYPDVSEAVKDYADHFLKHDGQDDQRIASGNDNIQFYDVKVENKELDPHDSFGVSIKYQSSIDYEDTEVDLRVLHSRESGVYFQGTNRAYGKRIDLKKGKGGLRVQVLDIPAQNCLMTVEVAIWEKDRKSLLFWSKIPAKFNSVSHATGTNYFTVAYDTTEF